jgi:ribose 5-phosphate isomerase B
MIAIDFRRQLAHASLDVVRRDEHVHRPHVIVFVCLEHASHARVTYRARVMKRFQMITEADARLLEYGASVILVRGGHVTPLALDTLRARRVTLVREGVDVDAEKLAPPREIRTVAIAGDHTGVALKAALRDHLRSRGIAVHDLGTDSSEPVDYPDTAAAAALHVARGEADAAIVIDGAGIGSSIAANKIPGIRAAMCVNATLARYSREHNGANVLALGSALVSADEAVAIVETFISTPMKEPRYIRRLAKIRDLEDRPPR